MSVNAGVVWAELGGNFRPEGFIRFGNAMRTSASQMDAAEKRMKSSAERTSATMHALGGAAKTAAIGGIAALGIGLVKSAQTAAEFEAAMRNVNSIAKLSERQLKTLSRSVLDLAGKTGQAPKTLAEGLYDIVSSGFKATDGLKILRASARAASAGLTDTATSTKAVVAVLNSYHLGANQAGKVSDQLFQIVNRGVLSFEDLAGQIGDVLPFASSLHVGLDQVGGAIATITKGGVNASQTMTGIKAIFNQLLSPSDDLSAAIKETGASSAEALLKHKGFQGALEALVGTTDGSKQAVQKLFPNVEALGAALRLTGENAKGAEADLRAMKNTSGATASAFKEQAKSTAFQWQKFKAELKATGVVIGEALLPMLTRGITALGDWITHLQQTGQLKTIGHDIADGIGTAVGVVGDLVDAARPLAGVFVDIIQAADGLGILPEIVAGIAAFKVAGVVAPVLETFGRALAGIGTGGGAASILGMLGPFGKVKAAAALLGGAIVALGSIEDGEAAMARHAAEAHRDVEKAIRGEMEAELEAADAGLAAKAAEQTHATALERVNQLRRDGKTHTKAYRDAVLDEQTTNLRAAAANRTYGASVKKTNDEITSGITRARDRQREALDLVQRYLRQSKPVNLGEGPVTPTQSPDQIRLQGKAIKDLSLANRDYIQALARRAVSQASIDRLMNSSTQITRENQVGIAQLIQRMKGVPQRVQSRILVENQSALAKAGQLADALMTLPGNRRPVLTTILTNAGSAKSLVLALKAAILGVPARTLKRILTTAPNAKAEVDRLRDSISTLQDKTVNVNINTHYGSSGTRPTGAGPAIPQQAAGGRTSGPQMYLVGEGSDPVEWIIPRDPKYRGRALGLLMDAAKSILPGAAGGYNPFGKFSSGKSHGHRYVPSHLDPLSLPVNDFENRVNTARSALDKTRGTLQSVPSEISTTRASIRDIERRHAETAAQKANKRDDLRRAKAKLKRLETERATAKRDEPRRLADLKARQKELHDARAYAAKISKQTDLADIAADQMRLADERDNQPGYNKAKGKRTSALKRWRDLLIDAQKHVPKGTPYWRELQKALGQARIDLQETGASKSEAEQAQQADQSGTYTDAEQAQLDKLNADAALASLTATKDDDIKTATELEAFLTGVLGKAQLGATMTPGGQARLAEVAGAVKSARDNLYDLTHAGKTPDLEAQLAQAQQQRDTYREEARRNAIGLSVLGPAQGAGTHITVQSLVPDSQSVKRLVASAVAGGIDAQNSRTTSRVRVG